MKGRQEAKIPKTKYTFGTSSSYQKNSGKLGRRYETATDDVDPHDGSGSLTYSAASSVHSGGESSNESSFADIMKVLDVQDSSGLATYLKEREIHHKAHQTTQYKDERSVAAESLAYSTDAESHVNSLATGAESALHGTFLLGADRHDEASKEYNHEDPDILFAPAEYSDSLKRRKAKKRQEKGNTNVVTSGVNSKPSLGTPVMSNRRETRQEIPSVSSRRPPTQQRYQQTTEEEEEVWYAKWWMFCFPDAIKNMTLSSKR